MPDEHAFFDTNPQSTILEDGESLIWYNWENGKHAVLGRDEIRPERDADGRLVRVEALNLSDDDSAISGKTATSSRRRGTCPITVRPLRAT